MRLAGGYVLFYRFSLICNRWHFSNCEYAVWWFLYISMQSIAKSECPKELVPADRKTAVQVQLMRKEENCPVGSPFALYSFVSVHHHCPPLTTQLIYFPCTDTREARSNISGHGKNFRQQLHIHGTDWGYHHYPHNCSSPGHGSSCGWYIAFYLNSAEVSRWHTNGFTLQLPPYCKGYPRLHWCFKAWGGEDLSTADSWIPSQTANWSGSVYWTGWTGQFCCDPEALASCTTNRQFGVFGS